MAKLNILGNAVVITSGIPKKDIETLAKFKPAATKLLDDDKKVKFVVALGNTAQASSYGIVFNGESVTGEATATFEMPDMKPEARAAWAKDTYGYALLSLNETEAQMALAKEACVAEFAAMDGSITVM